MMRVLLALMVLLTLTAFAPAPFPKTQRRGAGDEITLATFQGNWKVTNMRTARANGMHEPYSWSVTHIYIEKNLWHFSYNNKPDGGRPINIDPTKKPAHFHFVNQGKDGETVNGPGLIRRVGNKVEIIYTWGTADARSR